MKTKSKSMPRPLHLTVCISQEEKNLFHICADSQGLTLSQWVRSLLLKASHLEGVDRKLASDNILTGIERLRRAIINPYISKKTKYQAFK